MIAINEIFHQPPQIRFIVIIRTRGLEDAFSSFWQFNNVCLVFIFVKILLNVNSDCSLSWCLVMKARILLQHR